jgi:GT2 family glycosyltransferase
MPTFAYGTTQFRSVQALGGCCMSYRREIFLHYLFDEKLGQYAYMEDVDVAWRISRRYPLFYNPASRLQHCKSPANRAAISDRKALFIKNYSYLFFKNSFKQNRFSFIAYCWSIIGLFVCALAARDKESIKGYWRGLINFFNQIIAVPQSK